MAGGSRFYKIGGNSGLEKTQITSITRSGTVLEPDYSIVWATGTRLQFEVCRF